MRGFNAQFANKLLVLIDGRSVYMPLSSGVFWDVQDVLLEDVERIEIIRGPGAALWGAKGALGETAFYRAYGKYVRRDNSTAARGGAVDDGWDMARGSFRID